MMVVDTNTPISKLHGMRFPQEDHPGLCQALDDRRICSGDVILQQAGASGRRQTFDIEEILGSIGNAVQGAHILASLQGQLRSLCLSHGTLTCRQFESV
jgi:hypothetical protein